MDRHPLRRALPVLVALVLAGAVLGACGDDGTGDGGSDAAIEGAATFADSCAGCHGSDLRGTDQGPSLLSEVYEPGHHPDDAFRAAMARGSRAHHWDFGDMPPVPGLEPDEIEAVIAFVRDQQETHGFEPYPPR